MRGRCRNAFRLSRLAGAATEQGPSDRRRGASRVAGGVVAMVAARSSGGGPVLCFRVVAVGVRESGGGCAGEVGVAGPVAGGFASPEGGGVVVVAEEFGEDRGGDGDRERKERARSGGAWGDPELA